MPSNKREVRMSDSDLVIGNVIDDGDYIHITCTNCDLACEVDYLGLDAFVPQLKIVCPHCGELGERKLANAGGGFLKYTTSSEQE
jgi:predicted nucleic-acid-binding Zn-ribbon protein